MTDSSSTSISQPKAAQDIVCNSNQHISSHGTSQNTITQTELDGFNKYITSHNCQQQCSAQNTEQPRRCLQLERTASFNSKDAAQTDHNVQ